MALACCAVWSVRDELGVVLDVSAKPFFQIFVVFNIEFRHNVNMNTVPIIASHIYDCCDARVNRYLEQVNLGSILFCIYKKKLNLVSICDLYRPISVLL